MALAILGTGSSLPARIVDNAEVSALIGLSESHISSMFEVERRHWSRGVDSARPQPGQNTSDLAAEACRRALQNADRSLAQVDTLIAVSTTPDFVNPPLDYLIADRLGLRSLAGYTLQAACTGFFRAAALADALIQSGRCRTILIVAAESVSPFFRFDGAVRTEHRLNAALYADGAGAVLVGGAQPDAPRLDNIRVVTSDSDDTPGILFPGLMSAMPPGPEEVQGVDYLGYHDFRRVLEKGSRLALQAADGVIAALGCTSAQVDCYLTHQATGNIQRIGASFGIPAEKLPGNIRTVGNTISASVLILLDEENRAGRFRAGDRIILNTAESSTWSYGGASIEWA